jgi:2-polyprenyl-6-methoxyphenol hydroxylase-like FAD-dependent oxidoreductase
VVETIVIGGGQAGLAVSQHLAQRRREHVIFERARVAERCSTAEAYIIPCAATGAWRDAIAGGWR